MLIVLISILINMINILITGANGQLGSELRDLTVDEKINKFIYTDYKELDICNHTNVRKFIILNDIDIIINCAAYTQVDKAEDEEELANAVNNLAVENFAKLSKEFNIKLVHVSTDYVFDGTNNKPYVELDIPNPKTIYGLTKFAGEKAMQKINPLNSIIIRTSWVYSVYGNNFLKTILTLSEKRNELNIVSDQIGTPTYAADLALTIIQILPKISNNQVEVYHYSNEGTCSWFDFAKAIIDLNKINIKINPIESVDFQTIAKRPVYSVLNKKKFKTEYSKEINYWRDSLLKCTKKLIDK
jgi:dTDP-4-dehydrorhamnose reductase